MLIAPVLSEERGVSALIGTPRSSSSHRSQVTFVLTAAIVCYSNLALERETAVYFLGFQAVVWG
jgi:hypothetical protein